MVAFALLLVIEVLCIILVPEMLVSFSSVLPDRWFLHPLIYWLTSYLLFIVNFHLANVISLVVMLGLIEFPFLKEIRLGRMPGAYQSSSQLREMDNLIRVYKSTDILMERTNNILGPVLFPMQSVTTLICVFSSFEIIKHRNVYDSKIVMVMAGWAVLNPGGWFIMLFIGGVVQAHGDKILASWKQFPWRSGKERSLMARYRKSCKPLRIGWGKAFVLRRVSLMIYARGLIRGTVRCLLAFGK